MDTIEEKSIEQLTSKKKKFIVRAKKTVVALIISSVLISSIPILEYKVSLLKSKNNNAVEMVAENPDRTTEDINRLFADSIRNNKKLTTEQQEKIIKSFKEHCIEPYGDMFTDEMIYNMCAVAATESAEGMSQEDKEKGIYAGEYYSYENKLVLRDWNDETTIAHEQLHAVLRANLIDCGYHNYKDEGIGLNEGMTANFTKDNQSYYEEGKLCDTLGLIIGYDKLINNFYNSDLNGLKEEISKYLSSSETNELVTIMDQYTIDYREYNYNYKNNIGVDEETYEKKQQEKINRANELLKIIFESKYKIKPEDSNLGRIIFGQDGVSNDNWNPEDPFYIIDINNYNYVDIVVLKAPEVNEEWYKEVYTVNNDELKYFDIDSVLELARNNSKKR